MNTNYTEVIEKNFSSISDLIFSFNVTLLNKNMSIHDTVGLYLERN